MFNIFFNSNGKTSEIPGGPLHYVEAPVVLPEPKIEKESEVKVEPKKLDFESLVNKVESKIVEKQEKLLVLKTKTQDIENKVRLEKEAAKKEQLRREKEQSVLMSLGKTLNNFQKELSQRESEFAQFTQAKATEVAETRLADKQAEQQHVENLEKFDSWLNSL